ncbi:hypothetical protein SLE2022_320790 [Rubroshorea leprosula]
MSQLRVILQESVERERMDGIGGEERRRKSFKERLGFKGIGCSGGSAVLSCRPSNMSVRDGDEELADDSHQVTTVVSPVQTRADNRLDPGCTETVPVSSGMNLAEALAAERHFRASQEPEGDFVRPTRNGTVDFESSGGRTPMRVSLMRLLEETDCGSGEAKKEEEEVEERGGGAVGNDWLCCVCMGRKKGAAFIPCGHTFCRVCSREVWLNRGSCPLCNRSILEILDIF